MKFFLSSTVLASVMTPAFSFSYLDTLGAGTAVAAPAAPAPAAPVPAAPAAPAAPVADAFASVATTATTSSGYLDSIHTGEVVSGPGIRTHVDSLYSGSTLEGGAGIQTYASALPPTNSDMHGAGIHTYCDALSPGTANGASYAPTTSFAGASAAVATSAEGVAFTLETGDISGLVQDMSAGGTLRLTGSIDSISYN